MGNGIQLTVAGLIEDAFDGKKIAQISSGNQHSLALDEDGNVYAWGYAGYARLGLGDQKDQLVPTLVPQFSDSNPKRRAETIICGPTSALIVVNRSNFLQTPLSLTDSSCSTWRASGSSRETAQPDHLTRRSSL